MTTETIIAGAAAGGISELMKIAPVVAVLILVILGLYVVGNRLLDQCEKREERSREKWEESNERVVEAYRQTTNAMHSNMVNVAEKLSAIDAKVGR